MVERPDAHDVEAVPQAGLDTHHLDSCFRRCIRADGSKIMGLADRQISLGNAAVDIGARDNDNASATSESGGIEDIEGSFDVDPHGLCRVLPRTADIGLAGEVVHNLCVSPRKLTDDFIAIGDVAGTLDDPIAFGTQMSDEVMANKAISAGHQSTHHCLGIYDRAYVAPTR